MFVVTDNNVFLWLNSTTVIRKRSIYLQVFSKKLDMQVVRIKVTHTCIDIVFSRN